MAKKQVTPKDDEPTFEELMSEMKKEGILNKIPGSERLIRIRALEPDVLLAEGKMPDILTPLVIKMVYDDVSDKEVRGIIQAHKGNVDEAKAMLETLDFVCQHAIADGTPTKDLTIAEKRWIFRLALGSAELLIGFRYKQESDVGKLVPGDEVPQVPE